MRNKISLISVLLLLVCLNTTAQPFTYQFNRINISKGLSNNQVNSIYKDAKGFMWFGTIAGLNRYDGKFFKIFKHNVRDSTSLLDDFTTRIMEGPEGALWVDTRSGISIFNINTESFNNNAAAALNKLSIPAGAVTSIKKDKAGDYWFLMDRLNLYKYNTGNKSTSLIFASKTTDAQLTDFTSDELGRTWLIRANGVVEKLDNRTNKVISTISTVNTGFNNQIFTYNVFSDAQNELWIYTLDAPNGLIHYNPATGELHSINKSSSISRLNNNNVIGVLQDNKAKIWIGTDHGGINVLDKSNYSIQYIVNNEGDDKSLSQNSISAFYKDINGIMWIGTYKNGVNYYFENISRFPPYIHHSANKNSLPFDDVNCFEEDEKGNFWIGTNGGGLIYYDRLNSTYTQYLHNTSNSYSLNNDVIVSLFTDHKKQLWVGTYFGGLDRMEGNRFIHYLHDPANPFSISDNSIYSICEDAENNFWIGTLSGGLELFDRGKNIFYHHKAGDTNSVESNYIGVITEDKQGDIWVGTSYGVSLRNKNTGKFSYFLHDPANPKTISHNNILCIKEDSRGLVWLGTMDGLNLYNKKDKSFQCFRTENGLPSNSILNILEDNNHHLWISTPEGLSDIQVNINKEGDVSISTRIYTESDGLQGKSFSERAAIKLTSGELIFGGANGFNLFNPQNILTNKNIPNFIITDFQVFNNSITVGEEINNRVLLNKAICQTESITLKYKENVFSIEFADVNFSNTEKNKYAYQLEGFSKTWFIINDKVQKATFTNLDPGEYHFLVRSSNEEGGWNKETKLLTIRVLPPFWKTPLAFVLYLLLIAGILLLARYLLLQKAKLKYEIQHERQEANRMHELDSMKIKFITNVSHEFRTPLSLIITPLDKIIKNTDEPVQKQHFQLIQRNAKRLLNMVNQLLDFRKLEVQEIKLNLSKGDIVQFIKDAANCFTDIAEKKQVQLVFKSSVNELEAEFDKDKLERILFNLLSNAFKFTLQKGTVSVLVNELEITLPDGEKSSKAQIQVRDTGIGIPSEKKEKIFENFFQLDVPGSIINQGSGIGLSITKEFVRLHGGTIEVDSIPDEGSCFTLVLPLTQMQPQNEAGEIFKSSIDHTDLYELENEVPAVPTDSELAIITSKRKGKKPTVLLVEDNEDFRFYLKDNLRDFYTIIEAADGKAGWDKALNLLPDLIVTDVNMPEMNGMELCKKIKTDAQTSHIPVIILTARSAEEHQLEGFETGADDYMGKPFNFEILQSRIKNLLVKKERMRKLFQKQIEVNPTEITITSLDETFIRQALEIVEKNISEPDFSVEDLSRELFMSRVSLYRKIHSLTGKSPIEFIRSIRLKRAAQLLERSQKSISEIAYEAGFGNPKQFAKYFKAEFNVNPSMYQNQKRDNNKSS